MYDWTELTKLWEVERVTTEQVIGQRSTELTPKSDQPWRSAASHPGGFATAAGTNGTGHRRADSARDTVGRPPRQPSVGLNPTV